MWVALMVSGLQGDLLNPCRCDGSVRHTHQHCLLKWISERGSWTCELCCYRFQVVAINMKRPWQVGSTTKTSLLFDLTLLVRLRDENLSRFFGALGSFGTCVST